MCFLYLLPPLGVLVLLAGEAPPPVDEGVLLIVGEVERGVLIVLFSCLVGETVRPGLVFAGSYVLLGVPVTLPGVPVFGRTGAAPSVLGFETVPAGLTTRSLVNVPFVVVLPGAVEIVGLLVDRSVATVGRIVSVCLFVASITRPVVGLTVPDLSVVPFVPDACSILV